MHKTTFSEHAVYRVLVGDENGLRTKLSQREVKRILDDSARHVFLGKHKGRSHILFYSLKDKKYFIAIQIESLLITVEPLSYYNGFFEITDELLEKAYLISTTDEKYIKV